MNHCTRIIALSLALLLAPACGVQSLLVPLISSAIDEVLNGNDQAGDQLPDNTAIGRAVDLEISDSGRTCYDPNEGPDKLVAVVTVLHEGDSSSKDVEIKFIPSSDTKLTATPTSGVITRGEQLEIEIYATDSDFDADEFRIRTFFVGREGKKGDSITTALAIVNICSPERSAVRTLELLTPDAPILDDYVNGVRLEQLGEPAAHGNILVPDKVPSFPLSEISTWGRMVVNYDSDDLNDLFTGGNPVFELGNGSHGWTYRANTANSMPTGEYHLFYVSFAALFEGLDTSREWRFGLVVDSDGDPGNNYDPPVGNANDPTADTDLRFYLDRFTSSGWIFRAGNASGAEVASAARVVLEGNSLVFIVPRSEIPGPNASFRFVAFTYKGDPNSGDDWSGDHHPVPDLESIPD